jgi:hypothetical protein
LGSVAATDPFVATPLIQKIEAAQNTGDWVTLGLDYRFDAPAHFAIPTYGLSGELLDKEGAVIYEGMRLAVNADGRYLVRFVVGTPPVPVTFRLQLHLFDARERHMHTLTLPPFTIPKQEDRRHTAQAVQVVHHEGYLPVLKCAYRDICVVRRQGTARFGFGVDVP